MIVAGREVKSNGIQEELSLLLLKPGMGIVAVKGIS